jgi:hypothetical protein
MDNKEQNVSQSVTQNTQSSTPTPDASQIPSPDQQLKENLEQSQPVKKTFKKLQLKVDGQELEEELPFEVEDSPQVREYLQKQLQFAKVSQKRMAQAATMEKEIGAFLQALTENPEAVLSDPRINVDLEALAKKIIEKKVEQAAKTPEQLAQEAIQEKLKHLEEDNRKKDELIKSKEMERLQEKFFVEYNNSIDTALKAANLPVNNYMKGKMADYMHTGLTNGIDVKPSDVIKLVEEDVRTELKQMFEIMPSEVIESFLGKDTIDKFKKKSQPKQTTTPATITKTNDVGGKAPEKKKEDKMNLQDFPLFKRLGI